jgi:hypothetical protein
MMPRIEFNKKLKKVGIKWKKTNINLALLLQLY